MNVRSWILFFVIAFVSPAADAARTWSGQGPFHPPQTAAEKALDIVLNDGDNDGDAMTSSLLEFVTKLDDQKKNGTCTRKSGGFLDALLCEEFNIDWVLTCGRVPRDVSYLYRATSSNDHEAVVDVVWATSVNVGTPRWNTYHLIMDKTSWKVDGIDCGGLYKYNVSRKSLLDKFHIATSEPEKVLEKILRFSVDTDSGLYEFVYRNREHDFLRYKEFSLLFTEEFLERSRKEEKALVTESCGGKYPDDGMECDMIRGSDPITCAQDYLDDYVYHAEFINKDEVMVIYAWPKAVPSGSAYRMVHRNGHWMIDKIICNGYGEYLRP